MVSVLHVVTGAGTGTYRMDGEGGEDLAEVWLVGVVGSLSKAAVQNPMASLKTLGSYSCKR